MAKHLGLTTRRLQQLVAEGLIKKASRGQYDADAVTLAVLKELRERCEKIQTRVGDSEAKDRKQQAAAEREEIELARLKGQLIERDGAEIVWKDSIARISQKLSTHKKFTKAQKEEIFVLIRSANETGK